MRTFSFLLLFCSLTTNAQSFNGLVDVKPHFIAKFDTSQLKNNQIYIAMPFAKKTVLNPRQTKAFAEKVVIRLELVYTKFRTATSFNQKKLNKNRLKELYKLAPQLFETRLWDYRLISQTKGNSPEECNKMFHGFIITFRPNSTNNMLSKEADYLKYLVTSMLKNDSLSANTIPKKHVIKTHYDKQIGYLHDTIWYVDTVKPPSPPDFFYNQSLYKDSTVLNVFDRNKNWKNFIVVTDVTGSMSPYSAQVFVWLKSQTTNKKAQYFVFFNDGDKKPSRKKKPLETKGIYLAKNIDLQTVIDTAIKCMQKGSGGGERMENDIEAIIEGTKYCPKADEIILIADNFESMRDYKFIKKIKKPVHVILCGAENRINIQYLDLARQTKGTLHTIYSDILNLHTIPEGKHFFIDGNEYIYQNKKFHSVYSLLEKYK